jgi:hypothetical protein
MILYYFYKESFSVQVTFSVDFSKVIMMAAVNPVN